MTDAVNDPNPENVEDNSTVLIDTKPAAAIVPEVAKPVAVEAGPVEYEPTGDVGLDMALSFIGKAGLGQQHPAVAAAMAGDFSILKATLAAKGTPGWEQFVALGEAAYARTTKEAEGKATASREAIYKEAGGKDNWEAVKTWAGANATDAEKAAINELLNKGGLAAKTAVKYLMNTYAAANNVEVNPRDPVANAGRQGGSPSAESGPLSASAYAAAVNALNAKLRGNLDGSKEYANLQARRQMALK